MDTTQLYSTVQEDFVQTVRAVEESLGIGSEPDFNSARNMTVILQRTAEDGKYSDEVKSVLRDSVPVVFQMLLEYGSSDMLRGSPQPGREALTTKYVYLFKM